MAIDTDLSVSPYFDEAAAGLEKNYYKVLFKPSVPVQVRELNELQSILQNQIEEFGDNILKNGTIIRGCNFSFYNNYPYVKIKDAQPDGAPVNVSALNDCIVSTVNNHEARVIDFAEGFESTDPDTKTLYLKYRDSGPNGNTDAYSPGDVLYVRSRGYGVSNVVIGTAGSGYSNNDTVVFVSAIAVKDINGTITVGTQLTQPSSNARANVVSIDDTTYKNKTILGLKPVPADLTDSSKTAAAWTFELGEDSIIKSSTNSAVYATPVEIIGSGASAVVTTDSTGRVTDVSMVNFGGSYKVAPHATVRSTTGGSGVVLTAQNYKARVTVYDGANSVGYGYGFGVSDGVIYQKGYFLNVPEQSIVVGKYTTTPNNVSVGFNTVENIIDAYEDTDLLDNALGSRNYTAPGADRLQLIPELIVTNTSASQSNTDFFAIVEFSEGVPYKQNQRTVYSGVTDEMATRTADSAGDFVTDKFLVACKSVNDQSMKANNFAIVVDSGTAYIDGYRVQTYGNYEFTVKKGIDTDVKEAANVSLNYGHYVLVNELAGSFDFSQISTVKLYDGPRNYLSTGNLIDGVIAANGSATQIGTAKVRSIVYADGDPFGNPQGSPKSKYHMYLFDVQMIPGKSFKAVKSIFYDGNTYKGIADVILQSVSSSNSSVLGAVFQKTRASDGSPLNKMVFYSGFDSPLSINSISYQYRTFDDTGTTYTMSNTGVFTITLLGSEYFPYNTDLTDAQKQQLVIMPLTAVYANAAAGGAGNAAISSGNSTITSSNSTFTTSLRVGDYVRLANNASGNAEITRITAIQNSTYMTVEPAPSFSNSVGTVTRAFPKYVPFPILTRDGITATANTDGQTLEIDFGTRLEGNSVSIPLAAAFNISVNNASIATKNPNRDLYVKIHPANNDTGFGYSDYGDGINGTFTKGSNSVSINATALGVSTGNKVKIVRLDSSFVATVGATVTNSTMTLTSPVNFSGTADVYKAINLNGPWCLGVPDIFRLNTVYMANTSAVNTDSTNVTKDFVIDHNHTPNYADLGYLVKKKGSKLKITKKDWLLVKFSAFTRSHENRPVLINSYVSSNSVTRANNDAKPLGSLNNSVVNTVEIPEIHGPGGTFYDMISYIDFRPAVGNTATLSTTVAGADINPPYNPDFSNNNKKLPVPNSVMQFDIEYFMGRIDTVYLSSTGKIRAAKGTPNTSNILNGPNIDRMLAPIKNDKVMILNYLKIPAYPSLEENSDRNVQRVLDKKVINDVQLNSRIKQRTITRLLDSNDIELLQPQGYSMEDIGNLERRIRDLEYYVSLTLLELGTKDLKLPSSHSPNIDRFKFGFFTDTLDDQKYTDVNSPEYKAAIEDGRAVPPSETIQKIIEDPTCEFTNFSLVAQTKATVKKAAEQPKCIKEDASLDYATRGNDGSSDWTAKYVTMASDLVGKTGKVNLYIYNSTSTDNKGPIRVYQSKVKDDFPGDNEWQKAFKTAADCVQIPSGGGITDADYTYLRNIPGSVFASSDSFRNNGKSGGPRPGNNGETWRKRSGKITWNHNPTNGNYYKIVTNRNGSLVHVDYPINVSCDPDDGGGGGGGGGSTTTGKMKIIKVSGATRSKTELNNGGEERWTTSFHKIHVIVTSLKKLTKHKVFLNKIDLTTLCDPSVDDTDTPKISGDYTNTDLTWVEYNTKIPDGFFNDSADGYLMTDSQGKVEFFLYIVSNFSHSKTVPDKGSMYNKQVSKTTSKQETLSKPQLVIKSNDGVSQAHTEIKELSVLTSVSKLQAQVST